MKNSALIVILLIGVAMLGYLFINKQNNQTQNQNESIPFIEEGNTPTPPPTPPTPPPVTSPAQTPQPTNPPVTTGPNNGGVTAQNSNNIKYEQLPPDLKVIETSSGNASARATDRHFIVAVEFPAYLNNSPYCGFGNVHFPQCVFYITDLMGNPRKSFVWPTNSAMTKYPDSFIRDEYNAVNNHYLSGGASFSGDIMSFTTRRDEGCAAYHKEYWNVDYKTGEAFLIQTERISIPNGC